MQCELTRPQGIFFGRISLLVIYATENLETSNELHSTAFDVQACQFSVRVAGDTGPVVSEHVLIAMGKRCPLVGHNDA